MNAIIISGGAISASIVYCIMHTLQNIQAIPQIECSQGLYTALHLSQMTSMAAPQAPTPSSLSSIPASFCSTPDSISSRVIRMNMYWVAGLVFSISAVSLGVTRKQSIRDHRRTLEHQRDAHVPKSAPNRDYSLADDFEAWSILVATDAMYRLFQVSLVIFFLGNVDYVLTPIGVPIFVPVVIFGLLYVFGVIGRYFTPAP